MDILTKKSLFYFVTETNELKKQKGRIYFDLQFQRFQSKLIRSHQSGLMVKEAVRTKGYCGVKLYVLWWPGTEGKAREKTRLSNLLPPVAHTPWFLEPLPNSAL